MPEAQRIELRSFIDNHPFSIFQWGVLALCFLITTLDGLDTAIIGYVAPMLLESFGGTRQALGPTLGAALVGYAIGAMIAGPMADRFGRRLLTIGSVFLFGAWCLASSFATSLEALAIFRLLTGIGLGAAMPNATALMSEYAPARSRNLLVTAMFCGFTLGSAAGGFLAAYLIPAFGWRSVLVASGVLPLLAVPLLWRALPESTRFLVASGRKLEEVSRTIRKISATPLPANLSFSLDEPNTTQAGRPVAAMFSDGRFFGTVLLWIAFFMGLLVIYLLTSWLPTLIHDAGHSIADAARVGALWQIAGTFGALIVGWAMDRTDGQRVIAAAYLLGAAFVAWASTAHASLAVLSIGITGAGFCISGAQTSMNALAANYYPTHCRATGISWMLGIGRLGAIAGALCGGVLVALAGSLDAVMAALAAPVVVAGLAILVKQYLDRRQLKVTLSTEQRIATSDAR